MSCTAQTAAPRDPVSRGGGGYTQNYYCKQLNNTRLKNETQAMLCSHAHCQWFSWQVSMTVYPLGPNWFPFLGSFTYSSFITLLEIGYSYVMVRSFLLLPKTCPWFWVARLWDKAQSVIHGPAALLSTRSLLGMQNLRFHACPFLNQILHL